MASEALFTQGGNYDAAELRKLIAGIWSAPTPGGVIQGMVVTVGTGTSVSVSPGFIFVYDATGGAYLGYKTSATTLSISSNSGGGSTRIDTVQATISDPGSGGTAGEVILSVKTNTASVDALSIPLGTVNITTANAITITTPSRKIAEVANDANRTSTTPPTTGWTGTSTVFATLADRLANIEKGIVGDSHTQYVSLTGAQSLLNKDLSDPSNTFPAAPGVFPAGMVMAYAGASAPAGWLLCAGQPILRSTYAALFGVIGTSFGAGDGTNTFNVPDLRGRVVAGTDVMGGTAAGRLTQPASPVRGTVSGVDLQQLVEANLPAHNHMGTASSLTTGDNNFSHTHTGPLHSHGGKTSGPDIDHTHGIGAHSHGGITGGRTAAHNHTFSVGVADNVAGGSGGASRVTNVAAATGVGADRTVTATTNGEPQEHQHGINPEALGTGGAIGTPHRHDITADGQQLTGTESRNHQHGVVIPTVGQGTKVSVVQPTMQMNMIIKT